MTDTKLASPCGLYCGACKNYKPAQSHSLPETSSMDHHESGSISCSGCRSRAQHKCSLYDCCVNVNKHDFCFECKDFPCMKLAPYLNSSRQHNLRLYNLVLMKKIGVNNWMKKVPEIYAYYFKDPEKKQDSH